MEPESSDEEWYMINVNYIDHITVDELVQMTEWLAEYTPGWNTYYSPTVNGERINRPKPIQCRLRFKKKEHRTMFILRWGKCLEYE